jgi:3-oxoacyl-[acyl-carrier protein] reductase
MGRRIVVSGGGTGIGLATAESFAADGTLDGIADQYQRNVAANVLTAVPLTEALIPLIARPGGRIVRLSSAAALRGPGSYGGTKAADAPPHQLPAPRKG